MKTTNRKWMLAAVAVAVALGSGVAMARGDCGWGGKPGKGNWSPERMEQMQERMSTRVEAQLARLELALALQPEQRAAWETLQRDTLARVNDMSTRMAVRAAEGRPVAAPERMMARERDTEARLEMMKQTRASVAAFYETLGDAQKKVFDAEWGRWMGQGGKGPHSGKGWRS